MPGVVVHRAVQSGGTGAGAGRRESRAEGQGLGLDTGRPVRRPWTVQVRAGEVQPGQRQRWWGLSSGTGRAGDWQSGEGGDSS